MAAAAGGQSPMEAEPDRLRLCFYSAWRFCVGNFAVAMQNVRLHSSGDLGRLAVGAAPQACRRHSANCPPSGRRPTPS
eukprot:365711-Chlamydomonas_euryale.AAC.23